MVNFYDNLENELFFFKFIIFLQDNKETLALLKSIYWKNGENRPKSN